MFKYLIYQLIRFFSFWMPLKVAYWLGERVADIRYSFSKKSREGIMENLKQVLGDKSEEEIESKVREVFRNFAKYVVDFSRFRRINKGNLDKFITMEGTENLKRAFAAKKGVIALTAHLGNWELGGATLAILGYPINAVALNHEETFVNHLFVQQRTRKGVKVIPFGMAARRCFQALRRNEMVALLGDWDIKSRGMETPFFGKLTTLPRGPAILSLKTGAVILPGFTIRQEDDRFKLFWEKPIFPELTGDREKDVEELSKKVSKALEDYVRRYPEQWFLFHKVWTDKTEDRKQNTEDRIQIEKCTMDGDRIMSKATNLLKQLRFDDKGLVPAVVQEMETDEVLMLAYMNEESLSATLETGRTHFWSRSRGKLWRKGETSGCEQIVHEILFDCDADSLLIRVHQKGGACHTGYKSCFYRKVNVKQDSVEVVSRKVFHPEERYGKK